MTVAFPIIAPVSGSINILSIVTSLLTKSGLEAITPATLVTLSRVIPFSSSESSSIVKLVEDTPASKRINYKSFSSTTISDFYLVAFSKALFYKV